MDAQTLGAAIALMNKILPGVTSVDAGKMLVVGADGKWTKGVATENTISVSGHTLLIENIFGTTQSIVFDSVGNVQSITHKDGSNNTVRSDVFTFAANSITETRTLSTGESLTIVTNLTTLETTITYAVA